MFSEIKAERKKTCRQLSLEHGKTHFWTRASNLLEILSKCFLYCENNKFQLKFIKFTQFSSKSLHLNLHNFDMDTWQLHFDSNESHTACNHIYHVGPIIFTLSCCLKHFLCAFSTAMQMPSHLRPESFAAKLHFHYQDL